MSIPQAIRAVEDILFRTSNDLYDLELPLEPISPRVIKEGSQDLQTLNSFLEDFPDSKFLRLQFLDYTSTPRLRILPVRRALAVLQDKKELSIGITKASLGLLQNDTTISGVTATGEYRLHAILSSLRTGPTIGYAFVQGEFREADGV